VLIGVDELVVLDSGFEQAQKVRKKASEKRNRDKVITKLF
jgi:hypothetical protein